MTLRLPTALYERLRWHSYDTGTPMGQLVISALDEDLPTEQEIGQRMTERAKAHHGPALDKLADS